MKGLKKQERKVLITRVWTGDEGTFGLLSFKGFICWTLEPPWRDNQNDISCIPSGEYAAVLYNSRRFGKVYHIQNVQNRFGILTHTGCFGGDTSLGFITHTHGCVLLAKYLGTLQGQAAILHSRVTFRKFLAVTKGKDIKLHIREVF